MTVRMTIRAIDGNPEPRAVKAESSDRQKASGAQRGKLPIKAFFISCELAMIFEYISNIRLYFARLR